MHAPLNSKKIKPLLEINWQIREIFSEADLASFPEEISSKKYIQIEKK